MPRQDNLETADPHKTVDAPLRSLLLARAISGLTEGAPSIVVATLDAALRLGERTPGDDVAGDAARQIVATRHFAIISPSRDTVGHLATLNSPSASPAAKAAAHAAIARTDYAARHATIGLGAVRDAADQDEWHKAFCNRSHGALAVRLGGHAFVRAVGGYHEKGAAKGGVSTEASFILAGEHGGSRLSLENATALGHQHAQDSIVYSGPETDHTPRLINLHYNDDAAHPQHGAPLFGSHTPAAEAFPFHADAVRPVTPAAAHTAARRGKDVFFTHAYHGPEAGHPIPAKTLDQVAWQLIAKHREIRGTDVRHA